MLSFGVLYKNIQNKESPEWLKEKIISLGLKPISAVVDITNYVMLILIDLFTLMMQIK